MPTPFVFPGMDPWLEHPSLWSDVHFRIIGAIARDLAERVAPRYYIAVETRSYVNMPVSVAVRYPDVGIVDSGRREPVLAGAAPAIAVPAIAEPVVVEVPTADPIVEHYLEIRDPRSGEVITAIEVLSPTNKTPGAGRDQYLVKRQEVLITHTNLVEIDLLRAGPPMPYEGDAQPSYYRILVRRGREGRRAYLYPFNLRQAIPVFPLPLQADDEEPILDLNPLLRQIYREARYDLRLDYNRPPVPALAAEDDEWARTLVHPDRAADVEST